MKSIFEFKEYIETYKIEVDKNNLCAERERRPFNNVYIDGYKIVENHDSIIDHKHEYDIDLPQLSHHQRFYLEDVDIQVYIMDLIRTSNNAIKYTCYDLHIPKDKEEYEKLKEECEKKNKELIKQYEDNKLIEATLTPAEKEPEVKKGFFARLFSR